jgi:beta-mannanase
VAPGDLSHLSGLEQQIGQHVSLLHWYQQWGGDPQWTSLRQSDLQATADHRAVAFITWEPWDPQQPQTNPFPLKDIAAGRFDAHLDAWARGLRQFGRPVYLSFGHEMNEPTYPWGRGVNGNAPADYVAAYRHVHDRLVSGGAGNVRWVWTLDGGADPAQQPPASAYYPGDAYVDWLGTDTHNFGTTTAGVGGLPPGPPGSTWRSAQDTIGRGYDTVAAVNGTKPIMLAEVGSAEQGGDKAAWIRDAATLIPQRFGRIRAVAWFGSIDGPFAFLRLDSSPAALQAARDGFGRAPYCGWVS